MSQIDKLLNSLPAYPGMRIMHFANEPIICKNLSNFCQKSEDGEYLILTFQEENLEALKTQKQVRHFLKHCILF